jgi:hypothetical protein
LKKQNKLLHKMEADALKNEIEDMVADMLLNDGKDGNM